LERKYSLYLKDMLDAVEAILSYIEELEFKEFKENRLVLLFISLILFLAPAAAIDINDTDSLDYYSDSTLDFRVNPDGTVDLQNSLNANENTLQNLNALQDGTGTNTLKFDGSNNVEIPSGNLDLAENISMGSGQKISYGSTGGAETRIETGQYSNNLNLRAAQSVKIALNNKNAGYNRFLLTNQTGGENLLEIRGDTGNVNIPSGNLDISGQLSAGSTNCNTNEYIGGDGNCKTDSTGTDSQDLSNNLDTSPGVGYVEHDIQITGGSDTVARDYYEADTDNQGLSSVLNNGNSANQQIDMNGYRLNDPSDVKFNDTSSSGRNWVVEEDSSTSKLTLRSNTDDRLRISEGGNVEIPNGNLQMAGNEVQNANKVGVGTSSPSENLDVDGSASISSSGTSMNVESDGDVVVTLGG
jgi:hypothetical protein